MNRITKAETQEKLNTIRQVMSGKRLPRRRRIIGVWIHDALRGIFSNGEGTELTADEFERISNEDQGLPTPPGMGKIFRLPAQVNIPADAEPITGMVITDSGSGEQVSKPTPVHAITADPEPSIPKKGKWFKKKAKPAPAPVAPPPVKKHEYAIDFNTMTPWDEHIELNQTMRRKLHL